MRDTIETLSNQFNLSDEERKALLPSGTQRIVDNLIGWARTYLNNLITTSSYSKETADYVKYQFKFILIDGVSLSHYMIDYNVGVSVTQTLKIKRIDTDYFHEE